MIERWKTVSRKDPEFLSYLEGRFSKEHRALPVRSLNVDSVMEEVTFEIKPVAEINRPTSLMVAWQALRPQSLVFSIAPLLTTFVYCWAHDRQMNPVIMVSSFVGVLFFHMAVNLFNDYGDHMKGRDRIRSGGGSRVIQKGWLRAVAVKRAAWILTALALLCGLPAIFLHLAPVVIIAGVAGLIGLEFAFQKARLKYHGWAEIAAFGLTGPILCWAFAWTSTGQITLAEGALGSIFGAISLLFFHSANFENIMTDSQAGVRTWATRTGFDASKKFFYFTAGLTLISSLFYIAAIEREWKLVPALLTQILFLVPICLRVAGLKSPLASGLTGLRAEPVKLSWLTMIALVSGYLWIIASRSGGT